MKYFSWKIKQYSQKPNNNVDFGKTEWYTLVIPKKGGVKMKYTIQELRARKKMDTRAFGKRGWINI